MGRSGIPYLDWGMLTGDAFTAPPGESIQNGGAYCGKKQVFSKAEYDGNSASKVGWGYVANALNYIRDFDFEILCLFAEI